MNTLRDTDEGFDIDQIDPDTLRERPSLWGHPTAILLGKVGTIAFAWGVMVIPSRWITWWGPYVDLPEAIWAVIIGFVAGLPLAWYQGFIVGRFRTRNAAFYATRGGTPGQYEWRCPGMRAANVFSLLPMIIVTILTVGSEMGLAAVTGWVVPNLFLYDRDRQVHDLALEIIRQVKAKPDGQE